MLPKPNITIAVNQAGFSRIIQVKYLYNTAGQLEQVQRKESTDAGFINVVTNFNYSPMEQLTTTSYANGATTTNTYDSTKLYRMTAKVTTIAGSSHAQDLAYTYDANGNITRTIDASATSTSKIGNYVYDPLNRLTSATITNGTYSGLGSMSGDVVKQNNRTTSNRNFCKIGIISSISRI